MSVVRAAGIRVYRELAAELGCDVDTLLTDPRVAAVLAEVLDGEAQASRPRRTEHEPMADRIVRRLESLGVRSIDLLVRDPAWLVG